MPKTRKSNPRNDDGIVWYDSMAQASSALSVPLEELKRAKAAGSPHFKGGRVSSEVKEQILSQPPLAPLDKERLECERIEKQNRKLDFEHQVRMEKYVLRDEAKEGWAKGLEIVQRIMQTFIPKEAHNQAIREMKRELTAIDL